GVLLSGAKDPAPPTIARSALPGTPRLILSATAGSSISLPHPAPGHRPHVHARHRPPLLLALRRPHRHLPGQALTDLAELVQAGLVRRQGGGRNTRYHFAVPQ